MLQTTVKDILSEKFQEYRTSHKIYLFRDGETFLYVGQSNNALFRVHDHLGMDLINGGLNNQISTVGRLVYANRPNSDTWQVEFFTVWDCGLSPHRCWQQVNEAEQIMIRKYQPCLNIEHNRYPRAFPDSYILPPNELPDKFICNPKARKASTEYYISYYAYDWKTRRKKEYKSIMYAHSSDECQTAVIKLLGYQPESLNIMTSNEMRYGKVRPF